MPRPEKPVDPSEGPIAEFAAHLRDLREAVGRPNYDTLASYAHYSKPVLAEAARGRALPTWEVTARYVAACRKHAQESWDLSPTQLSNLAFSGELEEARWQARWKAADEARRSIRKLPI